MPPGDVYHYQTAAGEPFCAVVRRETAAGERVSQWTPNRDGWLPKGPGRRKRPLYRLPKLRATGRDRRIVVVGDEKCVVALQPWSPQPFVTTWMGGPVVWHLTDWTPLKDRRVSIVADADGPGRAAAAEIAAHLHRLGADDLGLLAPPGDEGDNIADWIESGTATDMVAEHLKPYEPPSPEAAEAAQPVSLLNLNELKSNQYFTVQGLAGEKVAVWVRTRGRILRRTREQCTSSATLIAFAPFDWWKSQVDGEDITPALARQLGDALIRIAEGLGPVDESLIYHPGPVCTKTGERIWNLGDRLRLEDGTETGLDGAPGIWISGRSVELGEPATIPERVALREAVGAYNWRSPADGQRAMAWIVTSLVGGMLTWRPHLLLVGPTDCGKSWFLENVVLPIIGPLGKHLSDATVEALHRLTAWRSLPIVVDEAGIEKEWVQRLFHIARLASDSELGEARDDERIVRPKGRAWKQGQYPRFSLLLSARAMPRLEPDARNRFSVSRLDPGPVDTKAKNAILEAMAQPERFRSAIILDSWKLAHEIATQYGQDTRASATTAVLTTGWRWWGGAVPSSFTGSERFGADAVHELLGLSLRHEGRDMTVAQALTQGYGDEVARRLGIRRDGAGTGLMVACTHPGLLAALDRTNLAKKDLRRILHKIPGTEYRPNPHSFGGKGRRFRPVVVPAEVLETLDIELPPVQRGKRTRISDLLQGS